MIERCNTQDCQGVVCGKEMTQEMLDQDGMCELCAGHVWNEMTAHTDEYYWTHEKGRVSSI